VDGCDGIGCAIWGNSGGANNCSPFAGEFPSLPHTFRTTTTTSLGSLVGASWFPRRGSPTVLQRRRDWIPELAGEKGK